MNKSIFAGLVALGVAALCDKPKPPSLYDGQKNLIKAEGFPCGIIGSAEAEGNQLILNNVTLDKKELARIFSGGFVVKPAQRLGMILDIETDGIIQTYENVWVEEMTPYKEGRETILIEKMICSVENTEEQPEQAKANRNFPDKCSECGAGWVSRKIPWQHKETCSQFPSQDQVINLIIKVGDQVIGAVQSVQINQEVHKRYVNVKLNRVRFDRARLTEAFSKGFMSAASQRTPFDVEVKAGDTVVGRLKNVWVSNAGYAYQTDEWVILDQAIAECESYENL